MKQLEEQLNRRDIEILTLRKEKKDLSGKLTKTSIQLSSQEIELLQSWKTWRKKSDTLEENFIKELAERDETRELNRWRRRRNSRNS